MVQQKGSNSSGIRRFNERLILSMLSKHGSLSKTELAAHTNLTKQAVMRIVNELSDQNLIILESKRVSGKGRPSEMYTLDPNGAFSIGVMVGRREIKIVLMDIAGHIISKMQESYNYPDPHRVIEIIVDNLPHLVANLSEDKQDKIKGLGIAMPWFLGHWSDGQEMPEKTAVIWESFDLQAELAKRVDYDIQISNDCTSAAAAELLFGLGKSIQSYLYIYIDSFIGGGLVLKGNVEAGIHANSAAIASYPVSYSKSPSLPKPKRPFEILLNRASLMSLVDYLRYKEHDVYNIVQLQQGINSQAFEMDEWIDDCCQALAELVVGANVILDFEAVVIDMNLNGPLLDNIIEKTRYYANQFVERDIYTPKICKGVLRKDAVMVGGAILPFYSNFIADKSVLFKPD